MSRHTARMTPALVTLAAAGTVVLAGCGGSNGGSAAASPAGQSSQQQTASTASASPVAATSDVTITSCGTKTLGVPAADVSVKNGSGSAASYEITVGFYSGGKHLFDGVNLDDEVAAGQSGTFTVVGSPSDPTAKTPATVSCKITKAERTATTG